MPRPVNTSPPRDTPQPKTTEPSRPKKWLFSFRFWRQIEYFGLDKVDSGWFSSLLAKLADLSSESLDAFLSDGAKKDAWRYHPIDWTKKNVPIGREDLTWLHSDYRDNPDEYPLLQLQISKSLGRIVGFWDEENVFNIVLLDPLHNIQPSKDFAYKVDPCSPLRCDFSTLLADFEKAVHGRLCPFSDECELAVHISKVPIRHHYHDVVILRIDEGLNGDARQLIEDGKVESIEEILSLGVDLAKQQS